MRRAIGVGLLIAAMVAPAYAGEVKLGSLTIAEPWARASVTAKSRNGVAYFTLVNHGTAADRLVGVASPVARKVALHAHVMQGDVMTMRPVGAIEVVPGRPIVLRPGGLHAMLMGLKAPLKVGARFRLTLMFEVAGSVEIEVAVEPFASMGPAKHRQE